jgi:hypothetical protein
MARVTTVPVQGTLGSRVVLRLTGGEELEATVDRSHGTPADPLTREEILGKFHECAGTLIGEDQRDRIVGLCERLEAVGDVREIGEAIGRID